ncbi:hypothetical protein BKI52_31540 [marine bacterium AO1-C]|nr:hypothetical protein BKI52_31540 [marine bacterium AO1-C]
MKLELGADHQMETVALENKFVNREYTNAKAPLPITPQSLLLKIKLNITQNTYENLQVFWISYLSSVRLNSSD